VGRITRSVEIRMIFDRGRRLSRGPLTLLGVRHRTQAQSRRVGVIVGRKFGGAVERNRAKRRLREFVRSHADVVPEGWDLLLLPRSPIRSWSFAVLNQRVSALFREWEHEMK
jgi:ribonuclease P protein component